MSAPWRPGSHAPPHRPISAPLSATIVTSRENSLACPRRHPISQDVSRDSPCHASSQRNTAGFASSMAPPRHSAGQATVASTEGSMAAPTEKKNRIRKKSRRGRRVSAMNCAMGELASDTPAMIAPTSKDMPTRWDTVATARHQPITSRKMNSLKASKRASSGSRTNLTPRYAPPAMNGKAAMTNWGCPGSGLPWSTPKPARASRATIAIRS